jgi:hypothetical protein
MITAIPFVMTDGLRGGKKNEIKPNGLCCEEIKRLYDFINRLPVHSNPDGSNFRYQDMKIHTRDTDDTIEGRYIDSLWYWEDPATSDYPSPLGKNFRQERHCFGFGFSYCPFCGYKYGRKK